MRAVRSATVLVTALAATVMMLTGCGLFQGSPEKPTQVVGNPADLELTTVRVAVLNTLDVAPIHVAIKKGFFRDEGLNIELVDVKSGPQSVEAVINDVADIAFSSYTPLFLAQQKIGGLKLVADATALAPRNSQIVVAKDSTIKRVQDLRGKRIAVVGLNTMAQLLVLEALAEHDVAADEVHWLAVPFNATAQALSMGSVDAAFLTEPFLTDAMKTMGARNVYDTNSGATEGIPLTGYGTSEDFVRHNPHTLAAFQRGIQRGTLAARDRREVEPVIVEYVPISPGTAATLNFTQFTASLAPDRIQRTANLMHQFGGLAEPLNVASMIIKPAALTR